MEYGKRNNWGSILEIALQLTTYKNLYKWPIMYTTFISKVASTTTSNALKIKYYITATSELKRTVTVSVGT